MLGFFFILMFFAIVIAVCWFVLAKVAPRSNARSRDRKIETAMRLGLYDAEAQQRIADKIERERMGE